jgi:hypothetical protein
VLCHGFLHSNVTTMSCHMKSWTSIRLSGPLDVMTDKIHRCLASQTRSMRRINCRFFCKEKTAACQFLPQHRRLRKYLSDTHSVTVPSFIVPRCPSNSNSFCRSFIPPSIRLLVRQSFRPLVSRSVGRSCVNAVRYLARSLAAVTASSSRVMRRIHSRSAVSPAYSSAVSSAASFSNPPASEPINFRRRQRASPAD